MCYNCGCGMADNPMGHGRISEGGGSLTEHDFEHIAQKWGMKVEDVKKNTLSMLQKSLKQS